MIMAGLRRRLLALPLSLGVVVSAAAAQQAGGQQGGDQQAGAQQGGGQQGGGAGVDREAMWPAPTAEDWQRPCLVTWQRSFEDAVAVSRETGKPILICVNMDGEIASEHYAGIRYRQPEIAALYEPYVTVIASVYRHNPRDYDEDGRRIPCPRFGGVTCGEHIAIEPGLFEKFMDGRRIAPRHIMVELDGEETFDVFYAWDTASVFQAIEDGIANRPDAPPIVVRGDRPIVERVASRDSVDRVAVEDAYRKGDQALRRSLLDAAFEHIDAAPIDLLRLGVFSLDLELSEAARRALARTDSQSATDLITDTLGFPLEATERDALIAALARIGESSPRARTLAVAHRGLATRSGAVDVQGWSKALTGPDAPESAIDGYVHESRLQHQDEVLRTDDAGARLELAEAFLARAFDTRFFADSAEKEPEFAHLLFLDAHRTALEAEQLGATGWRVSAVIALAAYYLKDVEEAHARAETAVTSLPSGEPSWNSMAVLELFAKLRCQAIAEAVREKKDWPGQWLTDANAACSVLARHPLGTDSQVMWHYDILRWLDAKAQAARVLEEGLARFPDSWGLHGRLRGRYAPSS